MSEEPSPPRPSPPRPSAFGNLNGFGLPALLGLVAPGLAPVLSESAATGTVLSGSSPRRQYFGLTKRLGLLGLLGFCGEATRSLSDMASPTGLAGSGATAKLTGFLTGSLSRGHGRLSSRLGFLATGLRGSEPRNSFEPDSACRTCRSTNLPPRPRVSVPLRFLWLSRLGDPGSAPTTTGSGPGSSTPDTKLCCLGWADPSPRTHVFGLLQLLLRNGFRGSGSFFCGSGRASHCSGLTYRESGPTFCGSVFTLLDSGSPYRRWGSPCRPSGSPYRRSGSPYRRSGSPCRRSGSPCRRSGSPCRRSGLPCRGP